VLTTLVLPAEETADLGREELLALEYLLVDALSEHARSVGAGLTALRHAMSAAAHLEDLMAEVGSAEAVRLCGDLKHSGVGRRVIDAATYVSGVSRLIRAA
jgi:hypothetical protein